MGIVLDTTGKTSITVKIANQRTANAWYFGLRKSVQEGAGRVQCSGTPNEGHERLSLPYMWETNEWMNNMLYLKRRS